VFSSSVEAEFVTTENVAILFTDVVGSDLAWGTTLAQRKGPGDIEKARELLTKAHSAAVAHGYGNVERRAMSALQLLRS
jgi:class 3 adenylate cyclase